VWSPDGSRVIFASDRDGSFDIYEKVLADPTPEHPIYRSPALFKNPVGWSPDGRWILISQLDSGTAQDLWLLPASGGTLTPYVLGPARDDRGTPSPDGRWAAYLSDDSGRVEIYVQSFPAPGHKVQVSEGGGRAIWWTADARQLLFLDEALRSIWRVDVDLGPTLRVGTPAQMLQLPPDLLWIEAMPDRQRFLAIAPEHAGPGSITIVQNWRAALKGTP
jgi:Tol biopolymer transport system component